MGDTVSGKGPNPIQILAALGVAIQCFELRDSDQHRRELHPAIRSLLLHPEQLGLTLMAITHPDDQALLEAHLKGLEAATPKGKVYTHDLRLKDAQDQWRWFELHHMWIDPVPDAPEIRIYGAIQEITARKEIELAAIEEARLYRRIFEDSPIGIAIGKPDSRYDRVNKALCDIVGYEWYPGIMLDLVKHTHPDDLPANLALIERQLRHKIAYAEFEKRYIRTDGEIRWMHMYGHTIYNDQGEIEYGVMMSLDITAWKSLEAERLLSTTERERLIQELEGRNAEMERFIYTVSHDLKSPLITVQGFLGYLETDIASGRTDRVSRDIEHISQAISRMNVLLQDLLELSRVGRLVNPYEWISLDFIVMEAVQNVIGRIDRINAILNVRNGMPTVYVDRQRIVEVFQNLLDNALKFMGDQTVPYIEIGADETETEVICFVRDNGMGIEPRYHEKIFGLFERLDPQTDGTGIGLALIRRIVETHNGRVWVESDGQNHGSTFFFTLPRKEPSHASNER